MVRKSLIDKSSELLTLRGEPIEQSLGRTTAERLNQSPLPNKHAIQFHTDRHASSMVQCPVYCHILPVLRPACIRIKKSEEECNKRPSIEENSEERNLVTIVNTAYQIYQPVHFNRVHGLTPLVTNQHEIDSGSTFSQVDLCISFCPNSCLRQ